MKYIFSLIALTGSLATFASIETTLDQVVSAFENSTTVIQYAYIEDIHDGRGYTAGKAGFTTATGDLWDLVKLYNSRNPNSLFNEIAPIIKKKAEEGSSSTRGLEKLPRIWKKASELQDFIQAQDDLVDMTYKSVARKFVKKVKFYSPLTYLVLYDSIIQQGYGDDPDSFPSTLEKIKPFPTSEKDFLLAFLQAREGVLLNATDDETRKEWRESVDRVYALRRLVESGNLNLEVPFKLNVWEAEFTIK